MADPGVLDFLDTGTAPSTPAASRELLYPKSGLWYYKGNDGVEHVLQGVPSSRLITAGAGLTGGGDLSADRTFDVVAGDGGLYAAADAVYSGITYGGLFAAASKVFLAADRGKYFQRSNSGSAMTDTMPSLTNTAADIGFTLKIANVGTVVAEKITFSTPAGTFNGSATYDLQYGCRQTFVWTGTIWVFDAGNGNIPRFTSSPPYVPGNVLSMIDSTGRAVQDGGFGATRQITGTGNLSGGGSLAADRTIDMASMVQATIKGRAAAAGTGTPTDLSSGQVSTILGLGSAAFTASTAYDAAGLAAAAQAASQPVDSDLTTIAGLTATTNNIIQSFGSAWASRTPTQVTSTLDVASQSLKGLMSAADKAGFDHDNVSLTNILDFAGDGTATTDNATPMANATAALPAAGGVIGFPVGQYLLGSNYNPAGRSVRICGDSKAQSNLILTHATADGITFNSGWYSGIENMQITGLSTQTTGVLAGGEAAVPVVELRNFPTAGSASFGGTAGWVTISWTGKSAASGAGNLTGCSGVTAAASGVWIMIRTGGYAVRLESNYSNIQSSNVYAVFDGILLSSALGYIDTVEVRQCRDNAVDIDGASADKFVTRLTTASSPLMEKSVNIIRTSSLLMNQCQILNGKIGLDFNPPNGATIPSVECVNCFFDNCTIGMRVTATGTGSSYRSKFTNCWFSSAATAGVQFATTQFDGFSFVNCDFYGNGKGIDAGSVGGGHWMIASSRMAQNTIAINLSGSAAHFPVIIGNEIGPTGAFAANTTGIVVTAGTYKGLIIQNNAVVNNTTNATLGAVTVAAGEGSFYRISDNAGINPLTGAAVTTPGVPVAGTPVSNTTGRRVLIFALNAATAPAAIVVNGVSTAQINKVATTGTNIVWLDPGGTIAFTTTTITSWTWIGN